MVKTALIVDDSRLARLTLKRLLSKYEIQVFEAEGVLDAEIWLSRNPLPDIVFMDIMMPELDGYEGLARLRAEPETRSLPVIMYSGDISDEARKKARDAGATGYLPKPADAGRLDHLLNALKDRMQQTAAAPAPTPAAPTSPAAVAEAPTAATPNFNIADAEKEFGLGANAAASAPEPAPAPSVAPAAAISQPAAPVVAGFSEEDGEELRRRIDILEKEIAGVHSLLRTLEEKTISNSGLKPDIAAEIDRHHRDMVTMQRKIFDNEKQSKLALILGGAGVLLGLVSFIWHLF